MDYIIFNRTDQRGYSLLVGACFLYLDSQHSRSLRRHVVYFDGRPDTSHRHLPEAAERAAAAAAPDALDDVVTAVERRYVTDRRPGVGERGRKGLPLADAGGLSRARSAPLLAVRRRVPLRSSAATRRGPERTRRLLFRLDQGSLTQSDYYFSYSAVICLL